MVAEPLVCALAIGGIDPGGGAGLAADLRAFHAAGVFGCAVVSLLTVQSTDGLFAVHPVVAALVVQQAAEVMRVQRVRAIKIGALGPVATLRAIAAWLATVGEVPVVLDPVMAPTRGSLSLLPGDARGVMQRELLPTATLVTANAPEAEALTGKPVKTAADAAKAARRLVDLGAKAALVKGGHLAASDAMVDVLALRGGDLHELRGPRLPLPPTHGGGCVLASLIAAELARGADVLSAVKRARATHQSALATAVDVGGAMRVLLP